MARAKVRQNPLIRKVLEERRAERTDGLFKIALRESTSAKDLLALFLDVYGAKEDEKVEAAGVLALVRALYLQLNSVTDELMSAVSELQDRENEAARSQVTKSA